MAADRVATAEEMMACLQDHSRDLHGYDDFFAIEQGLYQLLCGPQAETRVKQMVLRAFPTAASPKTPEVTMQDLKGYVSDEGFKMLPVASQNVIKFCITMVDAIDKDTSHRADPIPTNNEYDDWVG